MVDPLTSQELAAKVMEQAAEKYRLVSIEDIGKTMRETQKTLHAINNGLAKTNTLSDVPLEDLFYIHEGLINADNANFYDDISGEEQITSTFTVDVYDNGNGNYYIESADFIVFYNDLQTEIDLQIDDSNGEALIIASLELTGISAGGASFNLRINPGLVQNAWMTPSHAVYAADAAGWCLSGVGNMDAADFLRAYTNNVHGFFENNPCPTGQSPYAMSSLHYQTYSVANPFPNLYATQIEPFFWRSNTNACIGDDNNQTNNNNIWYSWYSKMDHLVSFAIPTFQSYGNRHFLRTDFKSYSSANPPQGITGYPQENYFHGGRFFYPICGCF